MMEAFGPRQRDILKLLLRKKNGLRIDEVAAELGLTRPSIRQDLVSLERLGYVGGEERAARGGGRPGRTYRLTKRGFDLFPKQYSWFSEVLLENLHQQLGSRGLGEMMEKIGQEIGAQSEARVNGATLKERVHQVAGLMSELAYHAETALTGKELPGDPPVIEAGNCVFHSVAARFPEICRFDIALLTRLTGAKVIHEQCILHGHDTCRFRFKARAPDTPGPAHTPGGPA